MQQENIDRNEIKAYAKCK